MQSKKIPSPSLSFRFLGIWLLGCCYLSQLTQAKPLYFRIQDKISSAFDEFYGIQSLKDHTNPTSLKVMTYNIRHASPPSTDEIDLDAIAQVINNQSPDLVAVQEVDVNTKRSGKIDQAQLLAKKTGMNYFFAKAIDYQGGDYGVLILSKYPIQSSKKHQLPTLAETKGEPRVLATSVVKLPNNKTVLFACTHLDAQKNNTNRHLQMAAINDILKNEKIPVVIGGDFNDVPSSVTISKLDSEFTRTCTKLCGFTIPATLPTKTIDYLAFKPKNEFVVEKHTVLFGKTERYASDHLPVLAVLSLQ